MRASLTEPEWRLLAERIRPLAATLIGDSGTAMTFIRDLDLAMSMPSGPAAKQRLRKLLTRHEQTRAWLRTQVPEEEGYRTAQLVRFLEVSAPENMALGQRVPLYVRITRSDSDLGAALRAFDVPSHGARVLISLWAPTLVVKDDMEAELTVPADGDSEPVRFGLVAHTAGLHRVTVRVFRNGTLLGETAVQLAAQTVVSGQEPIVQATALSSAPPDPGEVTLHVQRDNDGYRFQFLGEVMNAPESVSRLAADPSQIVERIVDELTRMAAGEASHDSSSLIRRRLQGRGAELWGIVPEKVREQFWAQAGRISSLTIVSELDVIPWELLYPVDGDRENGFLAETVPIVRWTYGHKRVQRLAVNRLVCVAPPPQPGDEGHADGFSAEMAAIRNRVQTISDDPVIEDLDDLHALVEADLAGILHLAGHHEYSLPHGPAVRLHGGELRPVDLELAAHRNRWKSNPLVFLNGCRTAGQAPAIRTNTGWADTFLRIGAGAFIGSLWGVRSTSAARFADCFYEHFCQRGKPLGQATMAARLDIMDEAGDPTWLAYSVYGSPTATVAGR
ncbi:CHAT domain-containing protein [Herbidospora daliensis]|uniref:CHAT domain-containing protein n=1 Tax=Herbidospora daliensis TaxID=295585 RepID=UPI000780C9DD|nr:CHAT domain-containing protein [Herbidospora daliensis]